MPMHGEGARVKPRLAKMWRTLMFGASVVSSAGCLTSAACVTGATQACACTNGRAGAQTCNADGSFAACVCDDPAGADASSSAADATAPKRMFVTSLAYSSTAASGACTDVAAAAGLAGTWQPWLARGANAIHKNFHGGPWQALDGTVLFKTPAQFGTTPNAPITLDETGKPVPKQSKVWTGFKLGGAQGDNCQNFTSVSDFDSAEIGVAGDVAKWTDGATVACSSTARIYCIEM